MRTIGWIRTHLGLGLLALLLCAAATTQAARLDADGNGAVAPATDGTLILRHLFGFTGTTLTTGALGTSATRDAAAITAYLAATGTLLDVDGDGRRDALTDGVLIKRYLLGRTGSALTLGAIVPGATRTTPTQIAAYLAAVDPVPYLQVDGSGILASIPEGTDTTLTSTVRLTNEGEVALPWHVGYTDDSPTEVTPTHGNLAPGVGLDVLVSVATAGFTVGVYSNPLTFTNDYEPSRPDSETGTRQLPIRIEFTPGLSVPPVLTAATGAGPGLAQVTWTFDPAASPIPIDGYRIDTSFDGGVTWNQALAVAGAALRTAQVSGLPQGLVSLRVAAYAGQAVSPVSNVLAVWVLGAIGILNDTGIDWCANETQNFLACPVDGYLGQDAQSGRDVTNNDDSDGHAGFSFTKLDGNGNPLAAGAATWSCVRDNVTGLSWEVKTDDGGLRDKDWTYSWYNPDAATNGGSPGYAGGSPGYADYGNNCFNPARCDTQKYVADVNAQGLCGAHDWRLPDLRELLSIVSNDRVNPAIDTTYFPNTLASSVLSASPYAYDPISALNVHFYFGSVGDGHKGNVCSVRLVRGGQ